MKQPQNSKLTINQNDEDLEISFPLSGFNNYMAVVGFISVIIVSFPIGLLAYGVYASEGAYKIISGLGSLPFLTVSVLFMWIFIGSFFSKPCVFIDSEKIIFTYNFFKHDTNVPLTILRQDINKIEYGKGQPELLNSKFNSLNFNYLGAMLCKPNLIIYTTLKEHSIRYLTSYAYDFSEAELEWLANEISNRLGLPIIRK